MTKPPALHPHSDRRSFNRLMLLIAAIAQNPGIAAHRQNSGVNSVRVLQEAMGAIAARQGIDFQPWSESVIKKDLSALRGYGILPRTFANTEGYRLGLKKPPNPTPLAPRSPSLRKSKLNLEEIQDLRRQKKTYREIADIAGISHARVGQILALGEKEKKGKPKITEKQP